MRVENEHGFEHEVEGWDADAEHENGCDCQLCVGDGSDYGVDYIPGEPDDCLPF